MSDRKYVQSVILDEKLPKESYIAKIPAIQFLQKNRKLNFKKNITFFAGDNGTGKSTLLEAIAVAAGLNPEGGTHEHTFSTYDTHSILHKLITIERDNYPSNKFFLRSETFYNVATYLSLPDMATHFHTLSHGESMMLSIDLLKGNGLYIMDEPESGFSPKMLLELMCTIQLLLEKNSQFIIATHSPILLAYPGADIYYFSKNGINKVEYKDTDNYQITKLFIDNPERMLKEMLKK